ncbi:winged helix-turn-helix transcriptional regulator [Palaeococcus ferrophilus]|uniref:winged helix-turn-helix transcriptional regulator n=1 Tax=Palaeococcus ferrophilus TaxID=83868 RepID=UPI00064E7E12|nr:winged helix-turn-helix transcriptional regulator [Palaeococcus ferrophilus]
MEFALPRSALKVLTALEKLGPASSKELSEKAGMSERTVRYALGILKEKGIVEELYLLGDTRRRTYRLRVM